MFGRQRAASAPSRELELSTRVGGLTLPNPVMTASGTAGHGDELGAYLDLGRLGAVVVKSLAAFAWEGNPAPRVHPTPTGMLNSVGLQGPGVAAWAEHDLPRLLLHRARVVVSIWGRTVDEYAEAAAMVATLPPGVVACEVNVSCPNLHDGDRMFAQSAGATAAVVEATASVARPRWAKLSPMVADLAGIAEAAFGAGADAVTLVNTMSGMVIDTGARRPVLGTEGGAGHGGGLSGPAIHPVAVRAIYDVRRALGDVPIVGVGGVASANDAVELLLAGACAVQVGTATFFDPTACTKVLDGLHAWCAARGVGTVGELVGAAHR